MVSACGRTTVLQCGGLGHQYCLGAALTRVLSRGEKDSARVCDSPEHSFLEGFIRTKGPLGLSTENSN